MAEIEDQGLAAFDQIVNQNLEELVRDMDETTGEQIVRNDLIEDDLANFMIRSPDQDSTDSTLRELPLLLNPSAFALGQGIYQAEEEPEQEEEEFEELVSTEPLDFMGPEENDTETNHQIPITKTKTKEEVSDLTAYVFGSHEPNHQVTEEEKLYTWAAETDRNSENSVDFNLPFENAPYTNVVSFQALTCRRSCDLLEARTRLLLASQCDTSSSVTNMEGRETILKLACLEKTGMPSDLNVFRDRAKMDRESQRASKSLVARFVEPEGPWQAWQKRSNVLTDEYASLSTQILDAQTKAANNRTMETTGTHREIAILMDSAMTVIVQMIVYTTNLVGQTQASFKAMIANCEATICSAARTTSWLMDNHSNELKQEEQRVKTDMIKLDADVDQRCASNMACSSLNELQNAIVGVTVWLDAASLDLEHKTFSLKEVGQTDLISELQSLSSALKLALDTSSRLTRYSRPETLENAVMKSRALGTSVWSSQSTAKRCIEAYSYLVNAYSKVRGQVRYNLVKLYLDDKADKTSTTKPPSLLKRYEAEREDVSELETYEEAEKRIKAIVETRSRLIAQNGLLEDERSCLINENTFAKNYGEREIDIMKQDIKDKEIKLSNKYVQMAFLIKWYEAKNTVVKRADHAIDSAKTKIDQCVFAEESAVETRQNTFAYAKRRCAETTEKTYKIASQTVSDARIAINSSLEQYATILATAEINFTNVFASAKTSFDAYLNRLCELDSQGFRSLNEVSELYLSFTKKVYEDSALKRSIFIRESGQKSLKCVDAATTSSILPPVVLPVAINQ